MKGRVLSILFAVVLSAGLIAGCSSKGSVDMPTEGDEDINIDNQVDGDGETGLTIYDIQNPDSPNHPEPNTSVTLRGVIATTGLFKVSDNLNGFFASDPEGGAWHGILVTVFKDTEIENFELGAKLIVSGTYKEFYEMSEIDADSVMVTGTGTVPDPVVIDDPCSIGTNGADAEMYESVLVELHDVTVTEGANQYGEFKVGDGACLIVDDKVFSYEAPAIGTTYSVLRGVMYYNFNEFKLNPRSADDMVVSGTDGDIEIDGEGSGGLTIYDIQNPDSPNHPAENSAVQLSGVVVMSEVFQASRNLKGIFVSDPEGGAWRGIEVVFGSDITDEFHIGDVVDIAGTYKEYYEFSEISATSITKTGTTTPPEPVFISDPCTIATGGADAESYEGVLVEVHNVTVTDEADDHDQFKVANCLMVDDKIFDYENPAVGTVFGILRGFLMYSFDDYKLAPRDANDMQEGEIDGDIDEEQQTDGDVEEGSEQPSGLTVYDIQNESSPNHPAVETEVSLSGVVVMSEVFQASRNLKGFFVSDLEGGAWHGIEIVFGSDITGEFHIGDVVDVVGTYKEYYEFSEISATSITKTGTTTPPDPVVISDPCNIATGGADAESYEGVLVEVHDVTVTDEADDHDQFKVANCLMVDDKIFNYDNPPVGTTYSVLRGFLLYSFDDYKLAPRDANDMVVSGSVDGDVDIDGEGSAPLTVYDIQNESSPNHPAVDTEVSLSGVVVMSEVFQAARSLKGFFVSDPEGGAWHGIEIVFDDVLTMSLNIGDVVDITGTYKEYYNFSEIEATSITINGTTTPPDPVVISDPCNIATGGTDAESYEGVLVEVHDVTVTDEADEHDQFKVANCLMVDDKIFDYENPAVGTTYSVLRGFLLYSFDDYKLAPRDENDMVVSSVPDGDEDVVSEDETEISESAETDGDVETSEDTETTETSENTETAQPADHLLITEISVTPTDGEFVEIYNPTDQSVDLSNYYLYNSTYGPNGVYFYNIPTGEGYGADSNSDFVVKFPDGASIAPGQYITIAVASASAFNTTYGMNPDYELPKTDGNDPNVPDMVKLTMASNAGLTNSSEDLVLLYWDGQSDLVSVVDYLIWGTKTNVRTDLTGVCIDGPDLDTEQSCYLDGVAVDNQTPATANNSSNTMQRVDMSEGAEVKANGNGITGHVEASEDLNNTWTTATATPGAAYTGN